MKMLLRLTFVLLAALVAGSVCHAQTPAPAAPTTPAAPTDPATPPATAPLPGARAISNVRDAEGFWTETTGPQSPGFHYYWLVIDDTWVADPASEMSAPALETRELHRQQVIARWLRSFKSTPVADEARYTLNAWMVYDFRMFSGRIKSSLQLNVQNLQEDGRLQPVSVRTDGTPWAYRIVDPRRFQLTLSKQLAQDCSNACMQSPWSITGAFRSHRSRLATKDVSYFVIPSWKR